MTVPSELPVSPLRHDRRVLHDGRQHYATTHHETPVRESGAPTAKDPVCGISVALSRRNHVRNMRGRRSPSARRRTTTSSWPIGRRICTLNAHCRTGGRRRAESGSRRLHASLLNRRRTDGSLAAPDHGTTGRPRHPARGLGCADGAVGRVHPEQAARPVGRRAVPHVRRQIGGKPRLEHVLRRSPWGWARRSSSARLPRSFRTCSPAGSATPRETSGCTSKPPRSSPSCSVRASVRRNSMTSILSGASPANRKSRLRKDLRRLGRRTPFRRPTPHERYFSSPRLIRHCLTKA